MITYLKHVKHGTKVATNDFEIEADKRKGWVEYDPASPQDKEKPKRASSSQNIFDSLANVNGS